MLTSKRFLLLIKFVKFWGWEGASRFQLDNYLTQGNSDFGAPDGFLKVTEPAGSPTPGTMKEIR